MPAQDNFNHWQWLITARKARPARTAPIASPTSASASVWYRPDLRPRIQRRPRSSPSPIGRSIGPSRRCSSSSGSATPSTTSPTPSTSPASPSPSRSTIPRARRSCEQSLTADAYGGIEGEYTLPKDATLGVYGIIRPAITARRRQLPRRGIQEAGVRGHGRGPEGAGHARREDHGHHQGQVLLRRPGHPRQGQVQGHAHQLQQPLVSARHLGLVLRPRLLVVRLRLRLVSGLRRVGLPAADAHAGGAAARSSRKWCSKTKSRSAPTAR